MGRVWAPSIRILGFAGLGRLSVGAYRAKGPFAKQGSAGPERILLLRTRVGGLSLRFRG